VAGAPALDECRGDVFRPSALPPAEGLWSASGADGASRVAVMIGPTEIRAGSTMIVRSVEAVETGVARSIELRNRSDTAVMRLDVLPAYGTPGRTSVEPDMSHERQSAAVYAVTPLVFVAAYEPCSGAGAPAIRYLRRDAGGRVAVDVMLRRESGLRDQ
jgi:hypothetical protein